MASNSCRHQESSKNQPKRSQDTDGSECKRPKGQEGESDYSSLSNEALHERLKAVDPDRAAELMPADRRKVERSLQGQTYKSFCLEDLLVFKILSVF